MIIRFYKDADFLELEQVLKADGVYYLPLDKRDIFKKKIEHDPESILIAEEEGKIIGTVFIIYDPWNAFIYHLDVHPDYRKKGVGTKLMEKAEEILKKRGMARPTLFVEEDNAKVIDFYKKRGWFVLYKVFCLEKNL